MCKVCDDYKPLVVRKVELSGVHASGASGMSVGRTQSNV